MTAFFHHFTYDFKTGIRDRSRLLMFYLFPLAFFFLIGGLMSSLNPGFRQTMIPAMVLFAFMCAALLNLPSVLVNARETGVFRSYRINGVPAASILSIPVLGTAVHMLIVALIVSVAGARIFNGATPAGVAGFVAAAVLSYAAYAGIGVLIGVAAGSSTASILIAQLIYIPSIMLGGLMVPTSMLPGALKKISLLLPATHSMAVFTGLSRIGASAGSAIVVPWFSIAVLAAGTILSIGLAAALFQWDTRASQPGRKAFLAILAAAPYVAAALIGPV
jgi:ABC-2 type transport system permease protein